jgi:hypothetical protein
VFKVLVKIGGSLSYAELPVASRHFEFVFSKQESYFSKLMTRAKENGNEKNF